MRFFYFFLFIICDILRRIKKLKNHAVICFFASLSNALHPTLNITAQKYLIFHSSKNDRNLLNVEFRR